MSLKIILQKLTAIIIGDNEEYEIISESETIKLSELEHNLIGYNISSIDYLDYDNLIVLNLRDKLIK